MYGIINRSMQELVEQHHGPETWARIRATAGIDDAAFVDMSAYDDAITYRLAEAAAAELGEPLDGLLHTFGRWWFEHTAREAYGSMLDSLGDTMPSFLAGLDDMHARIRLTLPELQPPSLSVLSVEEDRLLLRYTTHRQGLVPLLRGIIEAVGDHLGTPATTEVLDQSSDTVHETTLRVRWTRP